MSALEGVCCDGCGAAKYRQTVTQPAAGGVREHLKREGWRTTRGTYQSVTGPRGYSRDICPTCWAAGKR